MAFDPLTLASAGRLIKYTLLLEYLTFVFATWIYYLLFICQSSIPSNFRASLEHGNQVKVTKTDRKVNENLFYLITYFMSDEIRCH